MPNSLNGWESIGAQALAGNEAAWSRRLAHCCRWWKADTRGRATNAKTGDRAPAQCWGPLRLAMRVERQATWISSSPADSRGKASPSDMALAFQRSVKLGLLSGPRMPSVSIAQPEKRVGFGLPAGSPILQVARPSAGGN